MKKPNKLTLQEHFDTALNIKYILDNFKEINLRCRNRFNISNSTMKFIENNYGFTYRLEDLRNLLDRMYHDLITDEEFERLGHIYYNLDTLERKADE